MLRRSCLMAVGNPQKSSYAIDLMAIRKRQALEKEKSGRVRSNSMAATLMYPIRKLRALNMNEPQAATRVLDFIKKTVRW